MTSKTTLRRYADKIGALNAQIEPLAKELNELKAKLKDEGDGTYAGKEYEVIIATVLSKRVDSKKTRSFLTPAQIKAATVEVSATRIHVKERQQ